MQQCPHASVTVSYRSDQCFVLLGTGARECCMPPNRQVGAISGLPDVEYLGVLAEPWMSVRNGIRH